MDQPPALFAYRLDGTFVGRFDGAVTNYAQEIEEGDKRATWYFEDVDPRALRAWFDNRLMWRIDARHDGDVVFRGYIWEMELWLDGLRLRKSMADVANAVLVEWTDLAGDTYRTDWYEHEESINQYGRWERVVQSNSVVEDEAIGRALGELQSQASPYMEPPEIVEVDRPRLAVTAVGLGEVANHEHLIPPEDGTADETTVSAEVARVVEESSWLYALDIATIDPQYDRATAAGVSRAQGITDRLRELAAVPDIQLNNYELRITSDGGVIYRVLDKTPRYYAYPPPRGVERPDGKKPTWDARPGVIRFVDTQRTPALPETFLDDSSLTYASRTTMRQGMAAAAFSGKRQTAADIWRAIEAERRWRERALRR